ncbi:MAG: cytochrome bc1 complex cytochrome b subunit [Terriglobia bacterium]
MIDWLDSRLHLAKHTRHALNHVFPDHWSFMLGEIALYSFVILVLTGIYMMLFFHASSTPVVYHGSYKPLDGLTMTAAYASAVHLSFDVPAGLLMRQMHHWAALIFVAAIVAHMMRIFFTAAYRRPREINWLIGVTLLALAIFNGYFGYSLPGDLLSGAGLRIAYAITLSIPFIGPWMAFLFFGNTYPSPATIPRMYSLHIFLVPALIATLLALHLGIIWRQRHTNYPGPGRTDETIVGSRMWPTYAAKSLALFCVLFALIGALGGLVEINPIWMYGPYKPMDIMPGAQPDWYLGWIEGAMRLFPGVHGRLPDVLFPEIFFPAVVFPVIVFIVLYAYPFLEKPFVPRENRHVLLMPYQRPVSTALGCAAFFLLLVCFFAASDDVIAVAAGASVTQIRTILRVLFFVAPAVTGTVAYIVCVKWPGRERCS